MTYNELTHHGILGQKWGVRRYQNEDGSLTAAGKKRYYGMSKGEVKSQIKTAKKNYRKENEPYTFTGTTGKNWAKIYSENVDAVKNDSKVKEATEKRDKAYSKAVKADEAYDMDAAEKWQAIGDQQAEIVRSRTKEIGKSFSQKYSEALLKDIGYSDIEKGMAMLEDYGIENNWGKYNG